MESLHYPINIFTCLLTWSVSESCYKNLYSGLNLKPWNIEPDNLRMKFYAGCDLCSGVGWWINVIVVLIVQNYEQN